MPIHIEARRCCFQTFTSTRYSLDLTLKVVGLAGSKDANASKNCRNMMLGWKQ